MLERLTCLKSYNKLLLTLKRLTFKKSYNKVQVIINSYHSKRSGHIMFGSAIGKNIYCQKEIMLILTQKKKLM